MGNGAHHGAFHALACHEPRIVTTLEGVASTLAQPGPGKMKRYWSLEGHGKTACMQYSLGND
eukprot:CAMPEP_0170575720 /NCGR_PEP_ID=MMETSP0224-20130122/4011_1 /TAXON_ID=285029 /ORGANISM="Togula jolla, Strain CCCM 725" /LENGTH=61 /DNA_ID=CAMNT_0010898517 /DNA_START=421 /DNA_END=603 /DNA_ORIENTATION=-